MEETYQHYIIRIIPEIREMDPDNQYLRYVEIKENKITPTEEFKREFQSDGESLDNALEDYAYVLELQAVCNQLWGYRCGGYSKMFI